MNNTERKIISIYKKFMPKKLKVGGLIYKVIYPYLFESNNSFSGLHVPSVCELRIAGDSDGTVRSLPKVYSSLLHEIIHAIERVYCTYQLSHGAVSAFASGWLQIFADNSIGLKEEKGIPKNIKVGGCNYKIDYPYAFKDEPDTVYSACQHGILTLRISGCGIEGEYDPKSIRQSLVFNIVSAICSIYVGEYQLFDNNGNDIPNGKLISALDSLAHGFYQVFTDNDIENLIKKGIEATKNV